MSRIAIVDKEKCKPTKCAKECIKRCPPQRSGKKVIDIEDIVSESSTSITDKNKIAKIVESMCIGCGQCVIACPFNAVKIIRIPEENPYDIIHRYGLNSFRLYKLPILKKNTVIGLIGQNGIGKTTLIDILSNKILPNFEQFRTQPTTKEIITKFRGSVMQNYLRELYSGRLSFSIKEQKIKQFIKSYQDYTVLNYLIETDNFDLSNPQMGFLELGLDKLLDNIISTLSGGELQRLLIFATCIKSANIYIFDEPSNFLDVKQRLEIAKLIRSKSNSDTYVIVIEHDLSLMDYIADEINILFGIPSAYGIVSNSLTVSNGINEYLDGYISSQNIRFREEAFNLKPISETAIISEPLTKSLTESETLTDLSIIRYEAEIIEYPGFVLNIPAGQISLTNNINVILGENGTGKTTFINYLVKGAGTGIGVSYKDQHTNIRKFIDKRTNMFPTVIELFYHSAARTMYLDPVFQTDVINVLNINQLEGHFLNELSGGELQRVMIAYCLAFPANIYLLDEPSSNLDIENRLAVTKAIRKFASSNNKCIFVIEHDIMMSVSLAQEIGAHILFVKQLNSDNPRHCVISEPLDFVTGINNFLSEMNITMRIAGHNRPRINKLNSQMDQEQKNNGIYYG